MAVNFASFIFFNGKIFGAIILLSYKSPSLICSDKFFPLKIIPTLWEIPEANKNLTPEITNPFKLLINGLMSEMRPALLSIIFKFLSTVAKFPRRATSSFFIFIPIPITSKTPLPIRHLFKS